MDSVVIGVNWSAFSIRQADGSSKRVLKIGTWITRLVKKQHAMRNVSENPEPVTALLQRMPYGDDSEIC